MGTELWEKICPKKEWVWNRREGNRKGSICSSPDVQLLIQHRSPRTGKRGKGEKGLAKEPPGLSPSAAQGDSPYLVTLVPQRTQKCHISPSEHFPGAAIKK